MVIDQESIRGLFGWTTLEGVHIPFILRQKEKFTAVRIIERTLLKRYLQALPKDVYSCTYIKSYFITDNEAKLLNEINLKHCDRQYGHELFSPKDLVVHLSDVEQLYEFLSTCYHKLACPLPSADGKGGGGKEDRCGIFRVNGSIVPYVRRNGTKFVPLSLFDGGEDDSEGRTLDSKAETLEPWEASYLRFCCKMAGIEHELLKSPCAAVPAADAFRVSSVEEWWPVSSPRSPAGPSVRCWPPPAGDEDVAASVAPQLLKVLRKETAASNGFKPYLLGRAASPDLCYGKSDSVASQLHNLYGGGPGRESAASLWPVSTGLAHALASSSKSTGGRQLTDDGLIHSGGGGMSSATYPIPGLVHQQASVRTAAASGLPSPNPQPFIYNGQWWGALDSSALGPPPGLPHIQSLAAHCPQGPTQSSPNATQLPHDSPLLYQSQVHAATNGHQRHHAAAALVSLSKSPHSQALCAGDGTSYRAAPSEKHSIRISDGGRHLGSPSRGAILAQRCLGSRVDSGSKTLRASLDSRSAGHLDERHSGASGKAHGSSSSAVVNCGHKNGFPRITSAMSLVAESSSSHNGSGRQHSSNHHHQHHHGHHRGSAGGPSSAESASSFLARHLLLGSGSPSSDHRHSSLQHGRRSENHVVAPGNVQSLAGKMSSPKPGNQVPATVSGDHSSSSSSHRHSSSFLDGGVGRTMGGPPQPAHLVGGTANGTLGLLPAARHQQQAFCSKLQELLCQSDLAAACKPMSSSSSSSGRSPRYRVQTVTVTGSAFHAVNSIEFEHKTALMVPLAELTANVKPRMPPQILKNILINVFGVRLFESNRFQEEVLKVHVDLSAGDCSSTLICVEDLMKYLPQLLYTISRLRSQEDGREGDPHHVSKRARTEGVVNG